MYKCVCGDEHRYSQCHYLIESIRPANWKPDPGTKEKFDKAMAHLKPYQRACIKRAREWAKKNTTPGQSGTKSPDSATTPAPSAPPAIMTASHSFQVSETVMLPQYELYDSTILDSGATCHVGNQRAKFTSFTPAIQEDYLYSGTTTTQITGYGTLPIRVHTPGYPNGRIVQVTNVACVPCFHTSVISLRLFNEKGVFWDNQNSRLTYGKNLPFAETPMIHNQWVLEYNPLPALSQAILQTASTQQGVFKAHSSRHPRPDNQATFDQWHEMMGHLYPEALRQLPAQCSGVKLLTDQLTDPKCEICYINGSKRIPYRHPIAKFPVPFRKVFWDIIHLPTGMTNERYMLHFICSCSRINHVYSLSDRKERTIVNAMDQYSRNIETRWGLKIKILHGDGELSELVGSKFQD